MAMMNNRLELHTLLVDLLGSDAVYYQPPEGYKMRYPCIVYERERLQATYADDAPYLVRPTYQVTLMERDPDSELPGKMAMLPGCRFDRHFTSDNLHHNVYTITMS